ncbi:flagellar motor protein MotB [Caldovatus aquaticus]|uniref:OmpA family protein n=1 Tax=Caldovatus aquaticus TaxID=2865671 RepID=A0ABS7F4R3_9PROT|nr:flagellar motor protein MotB [Caldovatus aquaticus]MBW8270484.1 OmpA family protein [Caldovatus aquaticus]
MAGRGRRGRNGGNVVVVRRIEEGGQPHHGGAWKVAYADFVTAMMAFFLLMWLINATTEEQRRGIADFFSPHNPLGRSVSGSGGILGGRTPNEEEAMVSTAGAVRIEPGPQPIVPEAEEDEGDTPGRPAPARDDPPGEEAAEARAPAPPQRAAPAARPAVAPPAPAPRDEPARAEAGAEPPLHAQSEAALRAELARREAAEFERAAEQIRAAVRDDPALADLARQLLVEQTPEGLRIQLLDAERQPMFALGDSAPNERARALLARIAPVIARLPNAISIAGHTDATPFRDTGPLRRSNWDLSAERANATRRALVEAGVPEARIRAVTGHAERDPLLPEQPTAAANRRVSVTLLRTAPPADAPAATPHPDAAR